MKKSDLRDGDLIYLENGGVYKYSVSVGDAITESWVEGTHPEWLGLDTDGLYNEDLKAGIDLADGYEIVKVTREETIYEVKQMTLEEIEQELGYKIQIIEG